MDFSPPFPCSSEALVEWSPDGNFLASTQKSRLVLRQSSTLSVIRSHVVPDDINQIAWSPDSEFIAVTSTPAAVTHVFSALSADWNAKISHGSLGLVRVLFSPDSRNLVALSEFNLALTIWSLTSKKVRYIKLPKFFQFSPRINNGDDENSIVE